MANNDENQQTFLVIKPSHIINLAIINIVLGSTVVIAVLSFLYNIFSTFATLFETMNIKLPFLTLLVMRIVKIPFLGFVFMAIWVILVIIYFLWSRNLGGRTGIQRALEIQLVIGFLIIVVFCYVIIPILSSSVFFPIYQILGSFK